MGVITLDGQRVRRLRRRSALTGEGWLRVYAVLVAALLIFCVGFQVGRFAGPVSHGRVEARR